MPFYGLNFFLEIWCLGLIFGGSGDPGPWVTSDPSLLLTIKHCQALSIFNGGKQMFMELLVMECKGVAQMKKTSSCRLGPRACLRTLEALEF